MTAGPQAAVGTDALVVVSPSGDRGGAETMLLRAVGAAIEQGWRVTALVPAGPLHDEVRRLGARTVPIPTLRLPSGSRVSAAASLGLASLRTAALIYRHAGSRDVLLVNGLLALPAVRLTPRRGARVWWVHDVLVRRDRLALARACLPALDLLVGVSQASLRALPPSSVPTTVVRNGVDAVPPGLTAAEDQTSPVIGCNAALTGWKGQHVLLDAVAAMRVHDVAVELLGAAQPKDAGYEAQLRQRAARPDLTGRVRFLGHRSDALDVMRRWHIGVSASVDPEASGLGFLEGLSLGLPQVVTSYGGPAEVLGKAGLTVPPADPAAMAEALDRLLLDEPLWRRCSSAAPDVARLEHDRTTQEQLLLAALRTVRPRRVRATGASPAVTARR